VVPVVVPLLPVPPDPLVPADDAVSFDPPPPLHAAQHIASAKWIARFTAFDECACM
jgi:hypothetical protein